MLKNLGSGESRVKYVGKYRYVFRVFSLVFLSYLKTDSSIPEPLPNCLIKQQQEVAIAQV